MHDPYAMRVLSSGNIALLDGCGSTTDIVTPDEYSQLAEQWLLDQELEVEAEIAADAAAERHFEERGYYR